MNRKISLLVGALCGQALMGEAYAEAPQQKPVQFYAGLSGGLEHMSGKRIDSLDEENVDNPPDRLVTTYSNKGMSGNNVELSVLAGFLWKIPSLPILLGPEVYFGRGNTASSVKVFSADPFGEGNQRTYVTDFQRKYFAGALLRVGYQFCQSYLAHLGVGFDSSQFTRKRIVNLYPINGQQATFVESTKRFNGLVVGIGLERQFHQFIVGLDLRMIHYQRKTTIDAVAAPSDLATTAFVNLTVRPKIYSAALRFCYRF